MDGPKEARAESGTRPSIESLLEHRSYLHRLARKLLAGRRDESAASDLSQATWAAALENRSGPRGDARAYLSATMRNLLGKERRGRRRREGRESQVARPDREPSTDAIVEREEWRGRVLAAVRALPGGERDAILLRYFEGLPPRRIAKRLGIPVETVKTRIQRGQARLRIQLEEEHGSGDWLRGMALLAVPPGSSALISSALPTKVAAMGSFGKISVSLTLLACLVALGSTWLAQPTHSRVAGVVQRNDVGLGSLGNVAEGPRVEEAVRRSLESLVPTPEPEPDRPRLELSSVSGRVVDTQGTPIGGGLVRLWEGAEPEGPPEARVHVESDGSYSIENVGAKSYLEAEAPGYAGVLGLSGGFDAGLAHGGLDLVLAPAVDARVRFVNSEGDPIHGVELVVRATISHSIQELTPWPEIDRVPVRSRAIEAATNGDGIAFLGGVPASALAIDARHPEYRTPRFPLRFELTQAGSLGDPQEFVLERATRIRGVVVDAKEHPVEGADVELFSGSSWGQRVTDAEGRFEIVSMAPDGNVWIRVLSSGHPPRFENVRLPKTESHDVTIRLEPGLEITAQFLSAEGSPLANTRIEFHGDRFVERRFDRPGGTMPSWDHLAGLSAASTDARGHLRLEHLYTGTYTLSAPWTDDRGYERRSYWKLKSGTENAILQIDPDHPTDLFFEGSVIDGQTGMPVESFAVSFGGTPTDQVGFETKGLEFQDPEGRFAFGGVEPMPGRLYIRSKGYQTAYTDFGPLEAGHHAHTIKLQPSRYIRFRFVDAQEQGVGGLLSVVDPDGRGIWVTVAARGSSPSMDVGDDGRGILQNLGPGTWGLYYYPSNRVDESGHRLDPLHFEVDLSEQSDEVHVFMIEDESR